MLTGPAVPPIASGRSNRTPPHEPFQSWCGGVLASTCFSDRAPPRVNCSPEVGLRYSAPTPGEQFRAGGALSKLGSPAVTAWALPLFVMLREALPLRRRGSVDQFVPHSGHGISGSATPNRPVAVCNRSCSGGDRPDRWPVARSGASLRRTQTAATAATRIRNNDQH
jgi:hypothetical protein